MCECLWPPFFRTKNIHTLHSAVYLCRSPVYCFKTHHLRASFFSLVRMFVAAVFRTRNIHTLHSAVYYLCRLGSSRSAPTWRLVSDRHDPPTFAGVGVHYLKFTSAIPFRDMTSGVTVETVSNDSRRVVTTRQAVSKSHPFCDQLRIGCIGHECSSYILNLTSELPSFHRKKVPTTSTTTITTIITKTKTERMPSTVPSSNDHFVIKLLQFRNYDHAFPLWGKCIIFIFLF